MKCIKRFLIAIIYLISAVKVQSQIFYVSTLGNDSNAGSFEKPFKSLEKAKSAVRKINDGKTAITIYLREGNYHLNQPFVLSKEDGSENANITYSAYKDEKVFIRGSKVIERRFFKPIKDNKTKERISNGLKDSILSLDLEEQSIVNIASYKDKFDDDGGIIDVYMNGKRLPLSRYPNNTTMTIKKVLINGGGQESKNENWADFYNAGAPQKTPPRPGVFEYRDNRSAAWINALDRGVWLKGFWRIPWQNETVKVAKIDTINKTITLAVPVNGGIGNKYNRPEGNGKEPYWVVNLLEEVDKPGEWAIDFVDKKLYLYPPNKIEENNLRIADIAQPLVQMVNTSNIVLKNITIEENIHDGIKIIGGNNNLVAGCIIRNVTKNGITIDGGLNHTILSNDIYELGAGGIWLKGGDEKSVPKVSANFKIVNNHIYKFGQITRVYAAGINSGYTGGGGGGHHPAIGMYIAHNLVHDAPHVGVLFGSWNSVFEYNEIYDYCQDSDDMGGFYSYDQSSRMGGHTFAYNYIHDSSIGDGIYFDEDHLNMKIYGNIVALNSDPKRRGTGFLYKSGTQAKANAPIGMECYNNIAINCNVGFQFLSLPSMIDSNKIYNNVSVYNGIAFRNRMLAANNKERDTAFIPSPMASQNMSYSEDPGFEDFNHFKFNLKKDAKIFKDLPSFKAIPFEKIGLMVDEYRKVLPTDKDLKKFNRNRQTDKKGTDILDRG